MPQFMALNLTITAENADEVIAKLKEVGATARGEASEGVGALGGAFEDLKGSILGIIGIGGIGELFRTMAEDGLQAHDATVLLDQSVKNLGLDLSVYREQLDRTVESTSALGLSTTAEASQALQRLILITGDVAWATSHLQTAQDLAAATGRDLTTAATLLGRAYEGQWTMLERTGLVTKELVQSGGAMDALIAKVNGASVALTEGAGKWHAWWTEIKNGLESAGETMLNFLATLSEKMAMLDPALAMRERFGARNLSLPGMTVMAGGPGAHMMPEVDVQSDDKQTIERIRAQTREVQELQRALDRFAEDQAFELWKSLIHGTTGPNAASLMPIGTTFNPITSLGQQAPINPVAQQPLTDMWGAHMKQMQEAEKVSQQVTQSIQQQWERMASAMENALTKAFEGKKMSGVFSELGKSILQGLGQMFQEQGQALLQYGAIMIGLQPLLSNPFTSGPAAIAAGLALVALGAAFNAIATSGAAPGSGSTGGSAAGAVSPHGVSSTSYLLPTGGTPFAAGEKYPGLVQPTFNVIGSGDPRAMRDITQLLGNAVSRGYSVPGIAGS